MELKLNITETRSWLKHGNAQLPIDGEGFRAMPDIGLKAPESLVAMRTRHRCILDHHWFHIST